MSGTKSSRQPRVFISHAGVDKLFARRLHDELLSRNLGVWIDERELDVGDSIVQGIADGLKDTDYLVIVLSRASTQSKWVAAELDAALMDELSGGGTVVLPVLAEDCEMPPLLRSRLYADFREDFEAGLQQLLRSLDNEAAHVEDAMEKKPPRKAPRTSAKRGTCTDEVAKLSALPRKFGDVSYQADLDRTFRVPNRASIRVRSRREKFHSNGCAITW